MSEDDRPHAGPALATIGGLLLVLFGILFFPSANPQFGPSVTPLGRASWLFLTGPGLGAVVCGVGFLAYVWPRTRLVIGTALVPLGFLGLFDGGLGGFLLGPAFVVAGGLYCATFEPASPAAVAADDVGLLGGFRRRYALVPLAFALSGVLLAGFASSVGVASCPAPPSCDPPGPCPTEASYGCSSAPLWIVLLGPAVFFAPLAFLLRLRSRRLPLP
ncbi:MAG: hypothetical protein L3K07_04090 [Thermoplasmata archaeon]|nr:hypothetical protein [Thermoplasmata archaeon]